ncbi:hypothetical protein [Nannocystis radixulma]|uniref:CCHC-type domain-containing protein n=1 Tax=Nannocystis radixulma TaxID=2995305 RepID=A0ABT5BNF7_9BACT|nr:hypothetical protein [Nannocystis radixulma]MDC0675706.1 hypothetical protein [Nannocystis radixulma]
MACSRCGGREHNIQSCPFVRRCDACGGRGHDRRNCPAGERGPEVVTAPRARAPAAAPVDLPDELLAALRRCIAEGEELLTHLYWRENEAFRVIIEDWRPAGTVSTPRCPEPA